MFKCIINIYSINHPIPNLVTLVEKLSSNLVETAVTGIVAVPGDDTMYYWYCCPTHLLLT